MIKQSKLGISTFLSTLLLTMTLLFAAPSLAQDSRGQSINKAQAVQMAQQAVSGRVLRVDQSQNKYRVKVLQKSGRVVTVDVDKRTGRVTKQRSQRK